MADFLSGKNDILDGEFTSASGGRGDDFDFDRAASAFPDISFDGEGDIPTLPSASTRNGGGSSSGFSFDDFSTPPEVHADIKVTGDEEIDEFEDHFPDIEVPQVQTFTPVQSSFGATPTFAPRPQTSAFSSTPILNHSLDEDEPQVIKDWREKQAAEIASRDEASKARRQATISRAEGAIDEFYAEYASKKTRNIRENKEEEAEFIARLGSSLTTGTTWERIADIIELQNSQSKTIARTGAGTTDLTRYKEVLLRLKREGESAPGAAGY